MSGGIEAVPGIQLAKKMGLHVVVSDMNPNAPGFAEADGRIIASTYDVEATVAAAKRYHHTVRPIDGVICIASDIPLTVASVAAALNLPGISIKSAHLSTDKLAMKNKFKLDGVPMPWFNAVKSVKHLRDIVGKNGYPLVLKPADSRGARGVLRLIAGVDLNWAYQYSKSYSPTARVMVEEFLAGPQLSTESIVWDGEIWTPGISDRNYEYLDKYAPHIIENGGELPTLLNDDVIREVNELLKKTISSLGLSRGTIKGDIVVTTECPKIIELAPRLSGGYFCTHEIPLNTGVDFVGAAIKIALGEKPDPGSLVPKYGVGVAQRYFFPAPGKVIKIDGIERISSLDHIKLFKMYVNPGDIVEPIHNHPGRAGVLIAIGNDREKAVKRAIEAVDTIKIETVPVV